MTLSIYARTILALSVYCSFFISYAYAKSEIYTVRYSYEKQNQSGKKYYVLLPKVAKVSKSDYKDFKARSRSLFNALKGDKSRNYGKTAFATKKNEVFIFLDANKSKNHPFIMAEAVYTFTANGAVGVKFPKSQYKGKLYTRADIALPAYQLTLPYWKGLPPSKIKSALLSFPNGHFATSMALEKLLQDGSPQLLDHFKASFQSEDLDAIRAIISAIKLYPVKNMDQAVLKSLSSKSKDIRALAIQALHSIDTDVVNQALRKIMEKDKDEHVKDLAAQHLSKSKDQAVADLASFHALKSQDTQTALSACEALKNSKAKDTNQALTQALAKANEQLAKAIVDTLIHRKAYTDLTKVLDGNFSVERKVQVAQALVKVKKTKNDAYDFLVTQPQAEAVIQVCQALVQDSQYKNVLKVLSKALTHPDAEARIAAIDALVKINHKNSLKTLAKGNIEDAASGATLHQAMRDLYKKQKDAVILADSARSKSTALKSAATGTLGLVFKRAKSNKFKNKAFKACVQLSQSKQALVRAEAARCFGDIANKYAKEQFMKLLTDSAVEVQRVLYFSLRNFPADLAQDFLLKGLENKDAVCIRNAIDTLSLLKVESSFRKISSTDLRQHESPLVRAMSMQALGRFIPTLAENKIAGVITLLAQNLNKDKDLNVRQQAALSLGLIKHEDANFALSSDIFAGGEALTLTIIQALGTQNTKSSANSLKVAMDSPNAVIRQAAYQACATFTDATAMKELKKLLKKSKEKEKDEALQKLIAQQLKNLSK